MLIFDHVSVSYGKNTVLRDVCFSLHPGRITVLLGKNGIGKSTLLRCLSGLQTYTGSILLAGEDLRTLSARERAKRIGILPQLLPQTAFSCRTLVSLGRNPYTNASGRLSAADREQVERAMERAGVSALADRNADTLSGGEKQRVFLAMLLAQDTPVLLLDEPASFLDTDARRRLFSVLRSLADDGRTVLAVLHDLTEAMELADDVVILAEHTSVFSGSRALCLETGMPETWFGVKRYFCTNDTGGMLFFR
ncbi:MAG: ABC transporter ATP-binding protein [Clostridia bacterium]|nr:ABC transporter ATP-binding protein [Clostridia bacterium]